MTRAQDASAVLRSPDEPECRQARVAPPPMMRVGTAGWANPRDERAQRDPGITHLQRYAQCFNCVEINSSFYQLHRPETYRRWAESTASDFRFSVKIPRAVSHDAALGCRPEELDEFLASVGGLGSKLAVLLLQLPPRGECQVRVARRFFKMLKERCGVPVVCEPRHASWAGTKAQRLLGEFDVSWVFADPVRVPRELCETGDIRYLRLHGSPRRYWSSYENRDLQNLAGRMAHAPAREVWCIFDNTAAGAAWENAQTLSGFLRDGVGDDDGGPNPGRLGRA